MGWGIKRSKADALFSDLVRERDGWKCVRCGRQHEVKKNTLDCSHFFGRGKTKATRWDPENCDSLCKYPCHQGSNSMNPPQFGWEYQKQIKGYKDAPKHGAYTRFKIKQLGQVRFDAMLVRSYTPTKVDEQALVDRLKLELEEMKKKKRQPFTDYK